MSTPTLLFLSAPLSTRPRTLTMSISTPPFDEPSRHILPPPFAHSPTPPVLLTQGAEALVYRTHFPSPKQPCLLKYRPPKPYRHPTLDARLTKQRLLSEARMLLKCRRAGVDVPGVLGADWDAGWVAVEWVEGGSVRAGLEEWEQEVKRRRSERVAIEKEEEEEKQRQEEEDDTQDGASLEPLLSTIGRAVAALHAQGIVHGDLTTSNLMLRYEPGTGLAEQLRAPIALIDFGLASSTLQHEDRAVDLYVLERAFAATHPGAEKHFGRVLEAYRQGYKGAAETLKRLEGVRLRGRKRSMLG